MLKTLFPRRETHPQSPPCSRRFLVGLFNGSRNTGPSSQFFSWSLAASCELCHVPKSRPGVQHGSFPVSPVFRWQVPSSNGRFWRFYVLDSHGAENITLREVGGHWCSFFCLTLEDCISVVGSNTGHAPPVETLPSSSSLSLCLFFSIALSLSLLLLLALCYCCCRCWHCCCGLGFWDVFICWSRNVHMVWVESWCGLGRRLVLSCVGGVYVASNPIRPTHVTPSPTTQQYHKQGGIARTGRNDPS